MHTTDNHQVPESKVQGVSSDAELTMLAMARQMRQANTGWLEITGNKMSSPACQGIYRRAHWDTNKPFE